MALIREVPSSNIHLVTTVIGFDVLLTVLHLSIFISVFNQLEAQNLFHNKFYFVPLWYHHLQL